MAEPVVRALRIGDQGANTRFVLEISESVRFKVQALADPYRVVIELPDVVWRLSATPPAAGGLIAGYRYGRFAADASRVVLDARGPTKIAKSFLLPPRAGLAYRLVVDLAPASPAEIANPTPLAALPAKPRAAASPRGPPPSKPTRATNSRPMIVIDAGHGGIDPGAIGPGGTAEKELTLAFARELRRQLQTSGRYRVALTRDGDDFIRLRNRIAVARDKGADLFVSLHADAIGDPRLRGATVYTLSETASDKEAADLAAKENKADLIAGIDLSSETAEVVTILIDLAQRETMNESAIFAKLLTGEVAKTGRLLRNAHRFAGFAVLKAPDVPSVLLELGYLSNTADEKLLRDAAFRQRLNGAVVRAIDLYFDRQQAYTRP